MGLQINFPDTTDDMCEQAYLIVDLTLDNKIKKGKLELAVWRSKEHRQQNKQKINNVCLEIGDREVWQKDITSQNEEVFYVQSLFWEDFAWKSGIEIYNKTKTLKVKIDDSIIDLSESNDNI